MKYRKRPTHLVMLKHQVCPRRMHSGVGRVIAGSNHQFYDSRSWLENDEEVRRTFVTFLVSTGPVLHSTSTKVSHRIHLEACCR